MVLKNVSEAKTELSSLIEIVLRGEVVLIGKAGKPVARLVAYRGAASPRIPGALAGKIRIHPGFDDPLPADIAEPFGAV